MIKNKEIEELKVGLENLNIKNKVQEIQIKSLNNVPKEHKNEEVVQKNYEKNDENLQEIKTELQTWKVKYTELEYD